MRYRLTKDLLDFGGNEPEDYGTYHTQYCTDDDLMLAIGDDVYIPFGPGSMKSRWAYEVMCQLKDEYILVFDSWNREYLEHLPSHDRFIAICHLVYERLLEELHEIG